MVIAIVGGNGFLGKNLSLYLLAHTNSTIRVVTHGDSHFEAPAEYIGRVSFVTGDVLNAASIAAAIRGADVAYYFVHMMGQKTGNFYDLELQAANIFKEVTNASSLKRLVYMGGLGNDADKLSQHLAGRHRTGEILRSADIKVIELRASMIIGVGSVAFDIITNLVNKLPIMLLPKTASSLTQPITLADALSYLLQAATVKIDHDEIVEIGGPDVLSYTQIYKMYAKHVTKHRFVLRAFFVPAWMEAKFLDDFTPAVHARIGKAMVESLGNQMVVTSSRAQELFPDVRPRHVKALIDTLE